MAARPLLLRLALAAKSGALSVPLRKPPRRAFQLSATNLIPPAATSMPTSGSRTINQMPPSAAVPGQTEDFSDSKNSAFLGEADSNDGQEVYREVHGPPQPALEADNAAFLGEADSDDAFEVRRAVEGDKYESLDAANAAYLGEADSDDGFEARKAVEGDKHESLDAKNAAFLGEADSDDAYEADFDLNPERHRHKIEDTALSGFHGERGEGGESV